MFGRRKDPVKRLGFDELLKLKQNVDREIAGRQDTEFDALKARIVAAAEARGVSLAQLLGIKGEVTERKPRRQSRIRYRDPENSDNTWSGKGRPPKWLQEKLDHGATKEQFQTQ